MYQVGVRPSYDTGFAQWPGMSEYPQLWEGLVAAYAPFLGMTGNKVFDLSGNGNTGTFSVGNPTWITGKFGSAIDFTGNDRIYTPSYIDAITQTTPFSFGFGFRADSEARNTFLFAQNRNGSDRFSFICTDNASLRISMSFYNGAAYRSQKTADRSYDGKWHFIFGVFDGINNPDIYFDGLLDNSGAATGSIGSSATGRLCIGYTNDCPLDVISIYNRALSASEIALLYQLMMRMAG